MKMFVQLILCTYCLEFPGILDIQHYAGRALSSN